METAICIFVVVLATVCVCWLSRQLWDDFVAENASERRGEMRRIAQGVFREELDKLRITAKDDA